MESPLNQTLFNRKIEDGKKTATATLVKSSGHLAMRIDVDGEELCTGRVQRLESNLQRQLPDKFERRVKTFPITAEEKDMFDEACAEYEQYGAHLAEKHPEQPVTITRSPGVGYMVYTRDLDPALADYLDGLADDAAKNLQMKAGWEKIKDKETTVGDLVDAADRTRTEREQANADYEPSYRDERHEANCGARYSKSAACECGAA
jgi:hypothetical protein